MSVTDGTMSMLSGAIPRSEIGKDFERLTVM
jgi:hypothetical protein